MAVREVGQGTRSDSSDREDDRIPPSKALANLCCNLAIRHLVNGFDDAVPALRAACFNRRMCVRCPLGNRLRLVLPVLSAMDGNSLDYRL